MAYVSSEILFLTAFNSLVLNAFSNPPTIFLIFAVRKSYFSAKAFINLSYSDESFFDKEFTSFLSPIKDNDIDIDVATIDEDIFCAMLDEWNATAKKLVQAFCQFFRNEEKEEMARTANNNTLVMMTEDIGDAFHEGELYVMLGESDNMCVLMDEDGQLKYIPKKFVKIGASPFASA